MNTFYKNSIICEFPSFNYATHSALTNIYQKYLCVIEDIITLQIQGRVFLKIIDLLIFKFKFNIFIVVLSKHV